MDCFYGYERVSTQQQHTDRGELEITTFAQNNNIKLEKIFIDKQTGKNFDRPRYTVLKEDVLRAGDTLIVAELDRLGRNKGAILKELQYFKEHQIRVMILDIPTTLLDFSNLGDDLARLMLETINNMLIEMYAALAQAEMEKKEKRQREGIETMKSRGEWERYGRPRTMSLESFAVQYERVERKEITPAELMRELHMAATTYYRYRKQVKAAAILPAIKDHI